MCQTEMLKSFCKVLEIAGEWVVQGATVCTVWKQKKKKKEKEGGEQEHNSLVSVARLLFSSFYLHFSTTEFTYIFFFNRTNGIYPLSHSLPLQLLLLFLFILLALLVNERVCYCCRRTDGSCGGGDNSTRWLLNQLLSNKTQTGRLFMGGGN